MIIVARSGETGRGWGGFSIVVERLFGGLGLAFGFLLVGADDVVLEFLEEGLLGGEDVDVFGAGVFAVLAPTAAVAGPALLIGLLIAAVVAYGNATSSAQLAAQYPTSGGTYVYGRERLGAWPGFLAGWCFIVGKTASCAAMALTFAAYVAPPEWQKPLAIAGVAALTLVNCLGVLQDGFTLLGINAFTFDIVIGAAILIAMIANIHLSRLRHRGRA